MDAQAIPIVLFCGGKSSRMQRDKALLPFRNAPTLMQYQYIRLSTTFPTYISRKQSQSIPFDAPVIFESDESFAPTFGFIAACKSLRAPAFVALSVDTPFVTINTLQTLITSHQRSNNAITLAKDATNTHRLCGVYSRELLPQFTQMAKHNQHALYQMAAKQKTQSIYFDNAKEFININTPAQYLDANH